MNVNTTLPVAIAGAYVARVRQALLGGAAGLTAGLLYLVLLSSQQISPMMSPVNAPSDALTHIILSIGIGVVFGLLIGSRVRTMGSGIAWGILAGLIWWTVGPLTVFPLLHGARPNWDITAVRAAFPLLIGLAFMFGATMGSLYWLIGDLINAVGQPRPSHWLRAQALTSLQGAISGGLAGLLGGWLFGIWMEQAGFFPLLAGLLNSNDTATGRGLHFGISLLIGVSYGVLFQGDVMTIGSSIIWGFAYGLIWWIVGALTLMPWLLGNGVQWSREAAQGGFASLIGHLVYGITLGCVQAFFIQCWRTLFIDSDPMRRSQEGPGTRGLRSLSLGAGASVLGGLAFTGVMVATNALPTVASLAGMSSLLEGFLVHMVISILIGAAFGLLFRSEMTSPMNALGWGLVYGMVWWVLGPLTLMPLLLDAPLQWSLTQASGTFPSLFGHLLYGALLGLGYERLLHHFAPRAPRTGLMSANASQTAPALWALLIVLCICLFTLQG